MLYKQLSTPLEGGKTALLMVNLGTPDAPDTVSVRRYLKEFLWDPRVVEKPRWLWWLILNLVILRIRPKQSSKAYSRVWTDEGSPIMTISKNQRTCLQKYLDQHSDHPIHVELAMRYGNPSIEATLDKLQESGFGKVLVLPMYPQYCASTTASIFDEISKQLQKTRWLPEIRFISHYYHREDYIKALANSVRESWGENGRGEKLVISYHGIPKSYVEKGDPYGQHCMHTSELLQSELQLKDEELLTVFQSRVGAEEWLKPYCDKTLKQLPANGVRNVDIISPAFAADCLETLEELEEENRDYFMEAGGERYQYIPALNTREDHIASLGSLVIEHTRDWH